MNFYKVWAHRQKVESHWLSIKWEFRKINYLEMEYLISANSVKQILYRQKMHFNPPVEKRHFWIYLRSTKTRAVRQKLALFENQYIRLQFLMFKIEPKPIYRWNQDILLIIGCRLLRLIGILFSPSLLGNTFINSLSVVSLTGDAFSNKDNKNCYQT